MNTSLSTCHLPFLGRESLPIRPAGAKEPSDNLTQQGNAAGEGGENPALSRNCEASGVS
jgi:hypothetical protein